MAIPTIGCANPGDADLSQWLQRQAAAGCTVNTGLAGGCGDLAIGASYNTLFGDGRHLRRDRSKLHRVLIGHRILNDNGGYR